MSHVVNASAESVLECDRPARPQRRRRLPVKAANTLAQAGFTLEEIGNLTLEEVLAIPGFGSRMVWHLERALGRRFESHAPYWIERGLSARLAQALAAAGIRTEQELKRLRYEDLLKIEGIGPITARTLLSFGTPPAEKPVARTFLERMPQARIWVEAGIIPCCAARLVRAGITDLEALARASREDLLGIRGIKRGTLEKCERLLGRPLLSVSAYWREKGLPPQFANSLRKAGIESIEALAAMSRADLLNIHGIGDRGLECCEALLGHPMGSQR